MRIMGSAKTRVLPLPVYDTPTQSRPDRMTGSPCVWIGVGALILLLRRQRSVARGSRIDLKVVRGGGMWSPVASMRSFCRIVALSSSLRFSALSATDSR